jgi:hypothetical protein
VISIRPKLRTADDEYTPEQRRIVDAQLAEALADVKAGRVHGPFSTQKEFIASLHKEAKKLNRANQALGVMNLVRTPASNGTTLRRRSKSNVPSTSSPCYYFRISTTPRSAPRRTTRAWDSGRRASTRIGAFISSFSMTGT